VIAEAIDESAWALRGVTEAVKIGISAASRPW
jgi:hypothetical protein